MAGVITLRKSGQGGPEGASPNSVLRVLNSAMSDEVDLSEGLISEDGTVVTITGDLSVSGSVSGGGNAAGSIVSVATPPTTGNLAAGNIALLYTTGGAVVLYVNDGGVIRSLSLGVPEA